MRIDDLATYDEVLQYLISKIGQSIYFLEMGSVLLMIIEFFPTTL